MFNLSSLFLWCCASLSRLEQHELRFCVKFIAEVQELLCIACTYRSNNHRACPFSNGYNRYKRYKRYNLEISDIRSDAMPQIQALQVLQQRQQQQMIQC